MLWSCVSQTSKERNLVVSRMTKYDNKTLRGLSFRTKTSNLGAHLGWFAKASYQKAPSHGHTVSLQEFDSLYSQYNISPHKVDFVIPSIDAHSNAEGPIPMSYAEALWYSVYHIFS